MIFFRERERKRREAEEERAIEEAISEVKEARRKAAKNRRRRDSLLKKDRLGADKEYLVRLVGNTAMKVAELLRKCCAFFCVHRLSSACGKSFVC